VRNIYRRDAEAESIFRRGVNKNGESGICSLCVSASLRLILLCVLFVASCSVPNLEQPDCDQARDVVREFYSRHFGTVVSAIVPEVPEQQRVYLTPRFLEELSARPQHATDPFTLTDDPPKAFRAGECRVVEPGKRVSFELLLFWKTDTRSEQRAITVEAEKHDDKWLLDKVTN